MSPRAHRTTPCQEGGKFTLTYSKGKFKLSAECGVHEIWAFAWKPIIVVLAGAGIYTGSLWYEPAKVLTAPRKSQQPIEQTTGQ